MENLVVHRLVELHAATRGDRTALDHDGTRLTYRELNVRANAVARQLLDAGFRRGGHLRVSTDQGLELATTLLAVLKAGGAYTWHAPDELPWHAGFAATPHDDFAHYKPIDLGALLQQPSRTSPNLPVLTRPSDIACVLPSGERSILVPHSTIAGLRSEGGTSTRAWEGDPNTFDLWAGLMSGCTLSVTTPPAFLNAA